MALARISTRGALLLRRRSPWNVPVRLGGQAAALLGVLALPGVALAQLTPPDPVGSAAPGLPPGPADAGPAVPGSPTVAPGQPEGTPPLSGTPSPPISAISRLPPGMAAQARAGMLELLMRNPANDELTIVTQLPLPGATFYTLCIGGFLYVARDNEKIVVLDVHDLMHPTPVVSFPPGGPVRALWGGSGSLTIERSDGATLLFDVSDPTHPRYQSLISSSTPPVIEPTLPGRPVVAEQGQSRLAVSVRPFMYFANRSLSPTSYGSMLDFSYQYAKVGGIWWGIEVAPFVFSSYYSSLPAVNTRVWFGYSGRRLAFAAAMGSGITNDEAWLQFGLLARVGRLDGVHSSLRLLWSALAPHPYPVSGEFNLEGPVSQLLGLRYNFTGDSALNGFYTTLGLQFFVGGDHRWRTNVLTAGLGFAYMRTNANIGSSPNTHHPGVIFNFTVEPRW